MTSAKLLLLFSLCIMQGLLSACQIGNIFNRLPVTALSPEEKWHDACVEAYERREELVYALDLSLSWLNKLESHAFYPTAGITHEEALASTQTFRRNLLRANSPDELANLLKNTFDLITYDEPVLFTGYFAPEYEGSLTRSEKYCYPLYSVPAELVFDSNSRNATGWEIKDSVIECPTRLQLKESDMLTGLEIAWLTDPVDVYIIHVNGSGRILLPDGKHINVGHAATNGRTYTSIGKLLIEDGHIKAKDMSLQAIREYFKDKPDQFDYYALQNDRYVFFELLEDNHWPRGSLDFELTRMRSIATDKQVYPPGCVALVITDIANDNEAGKSFIRFMVDQDSGGAIKSPGRVDIYMGIGKLAGEIAGRQISRGAIYYLKLRR